MLVSFYIFDMIIQRYHIQFRNDNLSHFLFEDESITGFHKSDSK